MPSNPNVTLGQLPNPFLGESIDITLSFDNTGDATGYGPFVVLFLDKTGTDGDDGLTFSNASYLGSAITTTQIDLTSDGLPDGSYKETVTIHGEDYDVTVPPGFITGDSLVVFELPFGSFVNTQPAADISVSVDSSDLADLNQPLNITTKGGFVFGDNQNGTAGIDTILGFSDSGSVSPQLVTLQKNYLGPEDETATGPNFPQQYEVVVDIAPGQTIENLDISDILPDTMQFVRVVSIEDKDGAVANNRFVDSFSVTPDSGAFVPGGEVTRRIDRVTGGTGDRDLVMTVEFFVPRLDASGNVIINANSADDIFDQNESELGNNASDGNTWTPIDTRDSAGEIFVSRTANDNGTVDNFPANRVTEDDSGDAFNNPDEVLEEQSIAIQKSVTRLGGGQEFKPGDVLEYTLEFQVSDYFAFEDVIVKDLFSDGQRFDDSFTPQLIFNEHGGSSVANFSFSGYTPVPVNPGATGTVSNSGGGDYLVIDETDIDNTDDGSGTTELTFKVSELLNATAGQDNQLVGGGVPDDGFGVQPLNNNPPLNSGGTTGSITVRTVVQDTYTDNFPSGDASVDSADRLQNDATIDGAVLNVNDLSLNGEQELDDTSTEIAIASGNLYKSIYAINGVIASGAATDTNFSDGVTGYASGVEVDPGDEITYRLSFELPISDVEKLTLTDFFPLPAYDVNELAALTFDPDRNNLIAVPNAGTSKYGPAHIFAQDPIANPSDPNDLRGLFLDPNGNSLEYNFGTFDDATNQPTIVDLLVTATIQDEPVADGLIYTNQVSQGQQNTFNEPDGRNAIVQINLRQPVVGVEKDVVSVNNDPRADPNTLEAGDVVTFSVTLENTGSSESGAFDVKVNDLIPDGFVVPSDVNDLNIRANYGDTSNPGTALSDSTDFSSAINGNEIAVEFVDDPGATGRKYDDLGALEGASSINGQNKITVQYDLVVGTELSSVYNGADSEIVNTARATYANADNSTKPFPEVQNDATVNIVRPEITKELVTSSEASTSGENVAIGEVVRYRLIAEVPRGVTQNVVLRDNLPSGVRFINDSTAKVGFLSDSGLSSSDSGVNGANTAGDESNLSSIDSSNISVVLADANVSSEEAANEDTYNLGEDVYFKLGNLTNSEDDNNTEFVIVEFNALVANNAGNTAGTRRNNTVTLLSNDTNGDLVEHDVSNNVRITVLEPQIAIDKQVKDTDPDSPTFNQFINTSNSNFVQADTGDDVTFRTTFTNGIDENGDPISNTTTAFDVVMSDDLPAGLALDLDSISAVDSNGNAVNLSTANSSGNKVVIEVDELPVGETITVTYSANVGNAVTPEQVIISTAEVKYTSLPGVNGTPDTNSSNATGSSNTGDRGTINGERNGSQGAGNRNDYVSSDAAHVKAPPLEPIKSIVATSEASTSEADSGLDATTDPINGSDPVNPRDVTIGEVVRYRLEVDVPEGTIPDFTITDLLPSGLRFLDDNTAKVGFLSNPSRRANGVTSDTLGAAPQISGVSGDGTTPTGALPASAISGDGGDGFDSGENPIFSLGNITNDDKDGDGESIVIEFNALVENVIGNQSGTELDNSFTVDSSATSATPKTSNAVSIEVLEPVIDDLVFTPSPNTGDGNDTITYTAMFSNTGNTTAFDVAFFDVASPGLGDRDAANVVVKRDRDGVETTLTAGTDYTVSDGGNITVSFAEVAVDDAIEIIYQVDIINGIAPNFEIRNISEVRYTSLPGEKGTTTNPTGSATPGDFAAKNGERGRSLSGAAPNDYSTNSNFVSVSTPGLNAVKSIVATSETSTSEVDNGLGVNHRDLTIGEIVRYRLVVEIPEGTIENLQLTDSLPEGLKYLNDGSAEVALVADDVSQISSSDTSIGKIAGNETNLDSIDPTSPITATGGTFGSGTDPVFSLGTISNVDDDTHDASLGNTDNQEFAVVEFNAVVENITDNQDTTAPGVAE